MEIFAYDTFKSEKITNSMKEWAEFNMTDYNFMPTLEIIQGGEENPGGFKINDILDTSEGSQSNSGWYSSFPIDMEKLETYIEPTIIFR